MNKNSLSKKKSHMADRLRNKGDNNKMINGTFP